MLLQTLNVYPSVEAYPEVFRTCISPLYTALEVSCSVQFSWIVLLLYSSRALFLSAVLIVLINEISFYHFQLHSD